MTPLSHYLKKANPIMVGLGSSLLGNAIMFGVTIFLTRSFPVDTYGQFRLIFAFIGLCVIFFQLGRDSGIIYYSQKARTPSERHEIIRQETLYGFIGLIIATIFLYLFSSQIIELFLNKNIDIHYYEISLLMIILWGGFNILIAAIKSKGLLIESLLLSNLIQRFLRFPFLFILSFFSLSYYSLAWGMILSQFLLMLIAWKMLKLSYSFKDFRLVKGYFYRFGYALQLGLNSIIFVLLSKVDVMAIGKLSGNIDVAIYDTVVLVAFVVTLPFVALVKVSENFMQALLIDKQEQRKYSINLKLSIELSMSVVLFILIASKDILYIFGNEYVSGFESLIILSSGYLFLCFLGVPIEFLNMNGKGRVSSLILVSAIVLNIVLNIFLVPEYGLSGAAFSTIFALLFSKILGLISVYKYYPKIYLMQIKPTIMLPVFGFCVLLGNSIVFENRTWNLAFSVIITLFYLFVLYLLRYYLKYNKY